MKRAVAVIALMLIAVPAQPQFGIPGLPGIPGMGRIPVIDNDVVEQTWATVIQCIKTYMQLKETYDHMKYEATRLGNLGRFRRPMSVWRRLGGYARSRGQVDPRLQVWIDAVNGAIDDIAAWRRMTYDWPFPFVALGNQPQDSQDRDRIDAATIAAIDETSAAGLAAVGEVRKFMPEQEQLLRELVFDEGSQRAGDHTQTMLLQRSNLYAGFLAKQGNDALKLQTTQVEILMLEAKQKRDAYALAHEQETYRRQQLMADEGSLRGPQISRRQ